MYVATLLSNPARPALDETTVTALRNAWGGGDAVWLNPGIAAEFALSAIPGNRWKVWGDLQARGVDMAVQSATNRRKRMLLADMDSTMIAQECIDELADEAGIGAQVAEITARTMNGELEFEAALRERVALLQGLDACVIPRVLSQRISFTPGGHELVATMRAHGAHTALVSGGFTDFTAHVAEVLGFHEHRANDLLIADGRLTGRVREPILGRAAKVTALTELTARLGISDGDVLAVGDGANDLGMLNRAGAGVALHAKPAVAAQCDLRINHGDLRALLYLQGYRADQIIAAP